MTKNWKKVTAEKVTDVIDIESLAEESQALLKPDMRPEAYIEALTVAEKWVDAVNVMVASMPARESIWWVCMCAKDMQLLKRNKDEALALKAAEKWAFKPSEEHRLAAFEQAQQSANPSAGTLACMAVVFSGGDIETPEGQTIPFDKRKFAGIASAVVIIAAGEKKGPEYAQAMKLFLMKGINIACGGSGKVKLETAKT